MGKDKNIVEEIKSIRERNEFEGRYEFLKRLNAIRDSIQNHLEGWGNLDEEMLKYVPIATVACIEAFFRSVIQEIIDFGEPYSDNVLKFNQAKNVKFDFNIIKAIQNKSVSAGEIISHILPLSSLSDINSNLSTLLSFDFLDELKKYKGKSLYEDDNKNIEYLFNNYPKVLKGVSRTFELRHIFCHEFATNITVEESEIFSCFNHSQLFLNISNDFIWHKLYPNSPQSQSEMNIQASEDFKKKDLLLTHLIEFLKKHHEWREDMSINILAFNEMYDLWLSYRKQYAVSSAKYAEGGSLHSAVYFHSMKLITEQKIELLKKEHKYLLRKCNYNLE